MAESLLDPKALELLRMLDRDRPGSFSEFVRMFVHEAPDLVRKMEHAQVAGDAEARQRGQQGTLAQPGLAPGAGMPAGTAFTSSGLTAAAPSVSICSRSISVIRCSVSTRSKVVHGTVSLTVWASTRTRVASSIFLPPSALRSL